jgi:hypothetical protein
VLRSVSLLQSAGEFFGKDMDKAILLKSSNEEHFFLVLSIKIYVGMKKHFLDFKNK